MEILLDRSDLISLIAHSSTFDFEYVAVRLFLYQYKYNIIYQTWVDNLGLDPKSVKSISQIPFLPISAFKIHKLHCGNSNEKTIFLSSGTTGSIPSRHFVYDLPLYLNNTQEIFESFYGPVEEYCFLALLPSYLERSGSSLVAMIDNFIKKSKNIESGFYLYEHEDLLDKLIVCRDQKNPTILFGVSFALLDFIEEYSMSFPDLIIMETGGMKGRRNALTRNELHDKVAMGFGVKNVHSEYGMTELFSQAYSQKNGIYYPGKTMTVLVKDPTDPFQQQKEGRPGIINIVDLANIDSCAFIETQDLGKKYADGSFEILGRLDKSDIRGCNLMVGEE